MNLSMLENIKIVIIDDSKSAIAVLVSMLKEYKCQVQAFYDPIEALTSLKAHIDDIPDIIITDFEMPKLNGIELIREIRDDAFLKDVPTLILTGRSIPLILLEAINAGADAFASKDSILEVIAAQLMALLHVKRRIETSRAHDRRFKIAIDAIGDGVWDWDIVSNSISLSSHLGKMLCIDTTEFNDSREEWIRRIHPEDFISFQIELQSHLDGRSEKYSHEHRMLTHDGSYKWILDRGMIIARDQQGKALRMIGTHVDISKMKYLEIKFEEAQNAARIGSWSYDIDSGKFTWSKKMFELFGLDPSLGEPSFEQHLETIHPDDRTQWREATSNGLGFEAPVHLTIRRLKDENTLWINAIAHAVREKSGQISSIYGTCQDINEIKEAFLKLEKTQTNLEEAQHNSQTGSWEWDMVKNVIFWSKEQYSLFGRDPASGINFDAYLSYLSPKVKEETLSLLDRVLKQLGKYSIEHEIIRADGSVRWIHEIGTVNFNSEQQPIRMWGTSQDITIRKQAEFERQESENFVNTILQMLPVAVFAKDVENDFRWKVWNKRAEALFGISAKECLGKRDEDIFPEEYAKNMRAKDDTDSRSHSIIDIPEEIIPSIKGDLTLHTKKVVIRKANGEPRLLLGIAEDITDQKILNSKVQEAREVAEAANLAKSQFLANMSHELRTPMNAILGMLQLLERSPLLPHQEDYVRKTQTAAKTLLSILNDILDFSKIEAGKMTLEMHSFELENLLTDLSVTISSSLSNKSIEVLFDIDPSLPGTLLGDDNRLRQVLINLCSNAIKFTEKGEVLLKIWAGDRDSGHTELHFMVQDTGIGIAKDKIQEIFSGFSQAETSISRRFGGTGLGLAISKNFVTLMGGTLTAASEPVKGSAFSFSIRFKNGQNQSSFIPHIENLKSELRVLFIDDNAKALEIFKKITANFGWISSFSSSDQEGISLSKAANFAKKPFDIVIIDIVIQNVNSAALFESFKHNLDLRMPIAIATARCGQDMMTFLSSHHSSHIDGYLVKPFTAKMIYTAILEAQANRSGRNLKGNKLKFASKSRLAGVRLLLVEDNLINQQVASELLKSEGALVTIANNGKEALEAIKSALIVFHTVLMDIQMPVMDGFSATAEIRKMFDSKTLPIIAMTANARLSDRVDCLAASMNDHIGKPFSIDELINTLEKHLAISKEIESVTTEIEKPKSSKQPVLELQLALNRIGNDESILQQAIGLWLEEFHNFPNQIHQIKTKGPADVLRLLHSIKGTSSTIGAQKLADLVSDLESKLKSNPSLLKDNHFFIELEPVFIETIQELSTYIENQSNQATQKKKNAY